MSTWIHTGSDAASSGSLGHDGRLLCETMRDTIKESLVRGPSGSSPRLLVPPFLRCARRAEHSRSQSSRAPAGGTELRSVVEPRDVSRLMGERTKKTASTRETTEFYF